MRTPWSRHRQPPPVAEIPPAAPLVEQVEEPEPIRVLDRPERPMGYVDAEWISPVARQYLHPGLYPRLSPYFEHREYAIYVEARPCAEIIAVAPAEQASYEAGNIWGMCYSRSCVKGEEGHHHLSQLRPISAERFEAARAAAWAEL